MKKHIHIDKKRWTFIQNNDIYKQFKRDKYTLRKTDKQTQIQKNNILIKTQRTTES